MSVEHADAYTEFRSVIVGFAGEVLAVLSFGGGDKVEDFHGDLLVGEVPSMPHGSSESGVEALDGVGRVHDAPQLCALGDRPRRKPSTQQQTRRASRERPLAIPPRRPRWCPVIVRQTISHCPPTMPWSRSVFHRARAATNSRYASTSGCPSRRPYRRRPLGALGCAAIAHKTL